MLRALTTLLALLLAGCSPDRPADGNAVPEASPAPPFSMETLPPDSPAPVRPAEQLPTRPPVLQDSVPIEGDWQRERLTLVRSPSGFDPPFSTYVPEGLRTEFLVGDSTPSVRFVAAFAEKVNPDAYLQLRLYPPGATELVVRTAVDAYLRGRAPRQDRFAPSSGWPWSIGAWDFDYTEGRTPIHYIGTIAIARHGNRYLHVLAHYPAEYGDGVGPRFHRLLQEWRWEDDGSRLVN